MCTDCVHCSASHWRGGGFFSSKKKAHDIRMFFFLPHLIFHIVKRNLNLHSKKNTCEPASFFFARKRFTVGEC